MSMSPWSDALQQDILATIFPAYSHNYPAHLLPALRTVKALVEYHIQQAQKFLTKRAFSVYTKDEPDLRYIVLYMLGTLHSSNTVSE